MQITVLAKYFFRPALLEKFCWYQLLVTSDISDCQRKANKLLGQCLRGGSFENKCHAGALSLGLIFKHRDLPKLGHGSGIFLHYNYGYKNTC
jgi:hypothetical protein